MRVLCCYHCSGLCCFVLCCVVSFYLLWLPLTVVLHCLVLWAGFHLCAVLSHQQAWKCTVSQVQKESSCLPREICCANHVWEGSTCFLRRGHEVLEFVYLCLHFRRFKRDAAFFRPCWLKLACAWHRRRIVAFGVHAVKRETKRTLAICGLPILDGYKKHVFDPAVCI